MENRHVDFIIIGGGPAGLQLGHHLAENKRSYVILEAADRPGAFFRTFPRHRKLISINKVFTGYDDPEVNLRWDWNSLLSDNPSLLFKRYSTRYFPDADDMVRYLTDYADNHHLRISYNERVINIRRTDVFHVVTETGKEFSCDVLIIATGLTKPYIPPIPGTEYAEFYSTVSVDPNDFANQRVLIVGKGNSAFETANNIVETAAVIHIASPHPLKMAWKTHYVGHLRAVNNNILDTYQLKSQNAILDASVQEIRRVPASRRYAVRFAYSHAEGEIEEIEYDRVILCTGFRFDASFFDESCRPLLAICDRFPALTPAWESMNVTDLYFAGTLMQMRDFKKHTSGFIHGFRYNVRTLSRFLEMRYFDQAYPSRACAFDSKEISTALLERINRSSGLWQQPGYLGDYLEFGGPDGNCSYYEELPIDYIRESMLRPGADAFVVSLEYGKDHSADPFNIQRIARTNTERAGDSFFLHPVIRRFHGRTLVAEHHVIEDLAAEWREPEHTEPLEGFIAEQLAAPERLCTARSEMSLAAQGE